MSRNLPLMYRFLADEPAPRMLLEALKLYGTTEVPGKDNSPVIMAWSEETGVKGYNADSIPWCGLFMAVVAKRAGKPFPSTPLWALSWAKFGEAAGQPRLGDVLVFVRNGGGHVGLYVGEDKSHYHVLGGNQSDTVNIVRIAKERLRAARRHYAIGMPANCRPIVLGATGPVSVNEA